MRRRTTVNNALVMFICLAVLLGMAHAAKPKPLADVKVVQVDATVISNPEKMKEEHAPNHVADSLRGALRFANFEVGESPIRAHIILDEFTSGSTATRFLVGFGAGRSTIDCRLVIQNEAGEELVNKRIRVRGNLAWSPYQGNNTQRRQAVSSFEQKLIEELEALK